MTNLTGRFFPIESYPISEKRKGFDTLISAYSFEDRIVDSLKKSLEFFSIRKAILFVYDGGTYLDEPTMNSWKRNKDKIDELLNSHKVAKSEISCKHDDVSSISKDLKISPRERILIDVTGFTKNYILKLAQALDSENTSFLYTRRGHRLLTPEESAVSINRIEPLRGFEGYVSIKKNDLLVLILGFEGNRALAFLKKFETEPIFTMISSPYLDDEKINNGYIESAEKANRQLLYVHRVTRFRKEVHSLNPFLFAQDLDAALKEYPRIEEHNVCISCLGTKLQTLGLYLYWKHNPKCQIWYDVPNKRFDFSLETVRSWNETWMIEF